VGGGRTNNGDEIIDLYLLLLLIVSVLVIFYFLWRQWRHTHPTPQDLYLCLDGHAVRSRGEWMIDAALQYLGIAHEYEPRVVIDRQPLHPDFGLKHGIYLEYWGLETASYRKFKAMKKGLFARGHYHLINIENEDLKNLVLALTKQLRQLHLLVDAPPIGGQKYYENKVSVL